jgi:hypothetical protein
MAITREQLLAERFGVRDYEIPDVGTVRVRPLTRSEALDVVGREMDKAEQEQLVLSQALIEPKMTMSDVAAWQSTSPAGEIQDLVQFVQQISGLAEGAPKSGVSRVRA